MDVDDAVWSAADWKWDGHKMMASPAGQAVVKAYTASARSGSPSSPLESPTGGKRDGCQVRCACGNSPLGSVFRMCAVADLQAASAAAAAADACSCTCRRRPPHFPLPAAGGGVRRGRGRDQGLPRALQGL